MPGEKGEPGSEAIFLPHATGNSSAFAGGIWHKEYKLLFSRVSIKGRATLVAEISLSEETNTHPSVVAIIDVSSTNPHRIRHTELDAEFQKCPDANLWRGMLEQRYGMRRGPLYAYWSNPSRPAPTPGKIRPGPYIYKDSWPLESRAMHESSILQAIKGQHGAPATSINVIATYRRGEDWKDLAKLQKGDTLFPAQRAHTRIVTHTKGCSLSYLIDKPISLVEAVMDVAICLRIMLASKWLHRDISIGNVLYTETEQEYDAQQLHKDVKSINILQPCLTRKFKGFLIDGDKAIKTDSDEKISRNRSGTIPFISRRLLTLFGQPIQRTALDDLESLTWILVWVGLGIDLRTGKNSKNIVYSKTEEDWVLALSGHDIRSIRATKGNITDFFTSKEDTPLNSKCLYDLSGLLAELFFLHSRMRTTLNHLFPANKPEGIEGADEALKGNTEHYFEEYFNFLDQFIKGNLPPVIPPPG